MGEVGGVGGSPKVARGRLPSTQLCCCRLFKTTSPRGAPQDGLYCIRNSSTKSGKVGTKGGGPAGLVTIGSDAHPAARAGGRKERVGFLFLQLEGGFLGAVSLVGRPLALPRALQGWLV